MAVVTIAEAARLSGRSRASLYRAFKAGELSKTSFPDGSAGVDVSELMRAFGPLQGVPEASEAGLGVPKSGGPSTDVLEERIRGLESTLKANQALIEELRQRIEDKDELAEELRGQVRLLLMPPDRPAAEAPARRGILSRILGRG
jgi:hypothetical protein